jgi:hypothetical protein
MVYAKRGDPPAVSIRRTPALPQVQALVMDAVGVVSGGVPGGAVLGVACARADHRQLTLCRLVSAGRGEKPARPLHIPPSTIGVHAQVPQTPI